MPPIIIRLTPPPNPRGSTSFVGRVLQAVSVVVATTVVAILALVLAVFAAAAMLVLFLMHKLGWDRRLVGYVLKKQGVRIRTHADAPPASTPAEADAPIDVAWTVVEDRRPV